MVNAETEEAKQKKELKTSENWQSPRPDPPSYPGEKNPFRVGQYPVYQAPDVKEEVMRFTGELTGKMLLTRKSAGESEQGVQRPSQSCYDEVRQELEGLSTPQEEPLPKREEQVRVTDNTRRKKTDQESPRHRSTSDEETGSETSSKSESYYTAH